MDTCNFTDPELSFIILYKVDDEMVHDIKQIESLTAYIIQMGKNESGEKIVYEVKDIQNLLGIGRNTAYEFIRQVYKDKGTFRVLKI